MIFTCTKTFLSPITVKVNIIDIPSYHCYFFSLDSNIILIVEKTETEMDRKLQKRYRKCL